MKRNSIYYIANSAIFTAIIVIVSQLYLPTPFGIPLSLQTFAISLTGYLLGAKLSLLAVSCYILIGVIGIPVFAGFMGGLQHIIGPMGGFILGFIFLSVFCGIFKNSKNIFKRIFFGFIGLLVCYIIGIIQFSFVSGTNSLNAILSISLPLFVKDIVLIVISEMISRKILKSKLKIS